MNEFDKILIEQGISLIPRVDGTKDPPKGFRYIDRWDGSKIADLFETSSWQVHDRAAVCGVNHLVVFDFDSMDAYERFWGPKIARDLAVDTLCVRTSRGIQVWFFDYSLDLSKYVSVIDGSPLIEMEIFLQKHLAAVPNNTHPSGKKYQMMGCLTIRRKDGVVDSAVERLRSFHWAGKVYSESGLPSPRLGNLSEEIGDFDSLVEQLTPFWKRGHTHKFLLALTGYLIRRNISEDSALALVNAIIDAAHDDERHRREAKYQVHYAYTNAHRVKRLYGVTGLARTMLEISHDNGNTR